MATKLYAENYLPFVRQSRAFRLKKYGFDMSASSGTFLFPTGAAQGATWNVISGQAATATLSAAQSGSYVLFDSAAGIIYTLPAPVVGLNYTFITTVSITSNAAEVAVANEANTFMTGSVVLGTDNTASKSFLGNGTSHVEITSNGTTTGGLIGSCYTVVCVSTTLWAVNGNLAASGTLATPFSV
jgi:hypothetical protein